MGIVTPGEITLSTQRLNNQSDSEILESIKYLFTLSRSPFLEETHCSGRQSFSSIQEFLIAEEADRRMRASKDRKAVLTKERRNEFGGQRKSLALALIERDGYLCRAPGCKVTESLTIDHITPLSKGGSDNLANLQFLCRSHNSTKSDS